MQGISVQFVMMSVIEKERILAPRWEVGLFWKAGRARVLALHWMCSRVIEHRVSHTHLSLSFCRRHRFAPFLVTRSVCRVCVCAFRFVLSGPA
jgi:hypothetical protein